ncbi:glutaminase family protein [Novosphingobium kaempferiae]|uniref:glutaminase family protein n=1 Tax=Novosphingobium kaempferiae TaxID=2896849 RepID=UPI001E35E15E|nr:glutaminase family protein [Novosphingobium kaempferiae]
MPRFLTARGMRHATALMLVVAAFTTQLHAQEAVTARTPATPLVAHDPYFSIWSLTDDVTSQSTRHWTGSEQQMSGWLRVDGKNLRFMGGGRGDVMKQISRSIWPTRTIYEYEGGGVRLTATFFTPALPHDLDVLSRPVTYLSWSVRSTDARRHDVQLYFDASAQLAVDNDQQSVVWGSSRVGDMNVMRIGTNTQEVLKKVGDNLRIDWGWAQLAVPQQPGAATATIGERDRDVFLKDGSFPSAEDIAMPRLAHQNRPLMAVRFDFGQVGKAEQSRKAMLAYDDIDSIEYFKRRLPAYWRRNGMTMADLLVTAEREEAALRQKAEAFDKELTADLERVGGRHYAELAVLAYRQTLAAHKLVADIDGKPLYFSKENFSNGCIATVDITYPTSPFFLLLNPALLEAQLKPIMDYSAMPRWRFPFAPHDIGTYPQANGQVYGGGEQSEDDQMPVEETGNMLIMIAAMSKIQGNTDFATKYWSQLSRWAQYLREKGLDPDNQLSTDDFAGHLAHNANLSIKAISALDAYAELARLTGKADVAAEYRALAQQMAGKWMEMAKDGDHTKLAFDRPGTWSQKYNLVWDKILGRGLFPKDLLQSELAFYLNKQQAFGLPLDSRKTYTKLDWIVWTATLSDDRRQFDALIDPLYHYMTATPTRVPLGDWFETTDGAQVGFQARAVVGGVYVKMLDSPEIWKKWAGKSAKAGG